MYQIDKASGYMDIETTKTKKEKNVLYFSRFYILKSNHAENNVILQYYY